MGRQIQIYFSPEDVKSLEKAATEQLGAVVLPRYLLSNRLSPNVTTIRENDEGVVSSGYLGRAQDFGKIVLRHIPAKGYWIIDCNRSPIVELSGGFYDGKILRRGRLYYQKGFYGEDDQWVNKAQDFLDWAEKVFKLAKKISRRDKELSAYIGPSADQKKESGCALVFP